MAAAGEIGPMPVAAIFADTQDEPAGVYRWLDWLETKLPFPVYRVTKGSLSESSLTMHRSKKGMLYSKTDIPFFTKGAGGELGKIVQRGCTRDFKLLPLRQKQRALAGTEAHKQWSTLHRPALRAIAAYKKALAASRKQKAEKQTGLLTSEHAPQLPRFPHEAWAECQSDPLVISWVGISLDEIVRMKESRDPWAACRWPLIEARKSRHDCLMWMEARGFPRPPRSACRYCPFRDDNEWRRMKADEPEEFDKSVQFERQIQSIKKESENFSTIPFLHRSLVPLDKVDFSTDIERGQGALFNNECEGMCGV